jgi:DNA processing protein
MLNELQSLVALSSIPHLGSVKIRALIKHFRSATDALNAKPELVASIPEIGPNVLQGWNKWHSSGEWKKNLDLAEELGVEIIAYTDPQYPKKLLDLSDFPILLYIKGKFLPVDQQSIAVVGTRQASIYGREMAEQISQDLAAAGFTVVSGLARGIDTAAHAGALKRGRTIAVIGSGLADIYPKENEALAQAVSNQGVLVSEFPMKTPPDRQNFPQRNRIVSCMTMGSLLVEAPVKSGAMITMDKAYSYKRKLFALPGRADNESFRGNHALIKRGQAMLVENANDIISSFESLFPFSREIPSKAMTKGFSLTSEESHLWAQLPSNEITIDELVQLTKLPVMKINVLLMGMVLKKAVKEFPGKIYKKSQLG